MAMMNMMENARVDARDAPLDAKLMTRIKADEALLGIKDPKSIKSYENYQKTLHQTWSRAAELPSPAPLRHIGLYAYRAGFLRRFPLLEPAPQERIESLEQLRVLWHGERIAVHVSAQAPGPGVDTPEDLARVRALFGA